MTKREFAINEIHTIEGWIVQCPIKDDSGQFFGLRLAKHGKHINMWILRDEEGNGPGAIQLLEA